MSIDPSVHPSVARSMLALHVSVCVDSMSLPNTAYLSECLSFFVSACLQICKYIFLSMHPSVRMTGKHSLFPYFIAYSASVRGIVNPPFWLLPACHACLPVSPSFHAHDVLARSCEYVHISLFTNYLRGNFRTSLRH